MQYTHLGRSGLEVSRLCLGTMNFGPETDGGRLLRDHGQARTSVGINFFDTANVYGRKQGEGSTEKIVGRWFAQGGGRREKVGPRHQALRLDERLAQRHQAVGAQHPPGLRRLAQAAADRLHRPVPDAPRRPRHARGTRSGRRMDVLRTQGKILYVGLLQLRRLAHRQGAGGGAGRDYIGLVSEQSIYNLLVRDGRARGPAGGPGLRPRRDPVEPAQRRPARRRHPQGARGQPPYQGTRRRDAGGATARRSRPTRTSATSSARSRPTSASRGCWPSRLSPRPSSARARWTSSTGALRALEIELDDKTLHQLDEIFPGHKTAPEDYAW